MKILLNAFLIAAYLLVALSADEVISFDNHTKTVITTADVFNQSYFTHLEDKDAHTDHAATSSCADCHVGFCMHQVSLPFLPLTSIDLKMESTDTFSVFRFLYQSPYANGLKRPPRA